MSTHKKRQRLTTNAPRGAFGSKQTVSLLLIFLNIVALLALVYVLVNNQLNAGNAARQGFMLQTCAASSGFSCVSGTDCSGRVLSASDTALCCTIPCKTMPTYKRDLNADGRIDRSDLALLTQHLNARQGDRFFDPKFDIVPDGIVDMKDAISWSHAANTVK